MDNILVSLSPSVLALVPIVMGVVQISKSYIPDRLVALYSLAWAIALTLLTAGAGWLTIATWQGAVLTGVVVGLMASGVYSQVKVTATPVAK